MRICGIDPGSERTGYGIVDTDGSRHQAILFGAIRTSSRQPFNARLLRIYNELSAILTREQPDIMAIEGVFYSANVQSALKLGHVRGVALLAAAQQEMSVVEYSPLEIKSSIVGYGRAEKSQVQAMVQFLLGLPEIPTPDDAADALAVAICHCNHINQEILLAQANKIEPRP
jgi:crossover junction endodeoxyribonuclease RuvC